MKELLGKDKVILVRLIIGVLRNTKTNRRNPHYVPVLGFKDGEFSVIDPQRGLMKVSEDVFTTSFDAVHDCRRDHRMIVFG